MAPDKSMRYMKKEGPEPFVGAFLRKLAEAHDVIKSNQEVIEPLGFAGGCVKTTYGPTVG